MKPTVLLFNFSDKLRYDSFVKTVLPMKIKIKKVDKEDYLQPVGYLAGKKDIASIEEKYNGPEIEDEMLLISDLTDMELNKLLLLLRKAELRISLKAVLTQNNQNWNALQLYEELKKEHEALNQK